MRVPRPAARTTAAVLADGSVLEVTRAFSWARARASNDRAASSGPLPGGHGLYLNPRALRQGRDLEGRASRGRIREEPGVDGVEGGEVSDVREEAGRLDDVGHRAARGVEHGRKVLERPLGLRLETALDELAGCRIEAHLPGAEHEVVRRDRLAVRPDSGRRSARADGSTG